VYLLSDQHQCSLLEFAPMEVKQAITGFGGAPKEQVARVIAQLFPHIASLMISFPHDVTDAIAVSLCGLWRCPRELLNH
jgi:crossover junction endodeoxyribonuclease RuvC